MLREPVGNPTVRAQERDFSGRIGRPRSCCVAIAMAAMDLRQVRIIALGVVLGLSACGGIQPYTKPVGMLSVPSRIPTEQRWAYLQSHLAEDGWQIERTDRAASELVAFKPDAKDPDLRERLVVKLSPATSAAVVLSELRTGDRWRTPPVVCSSYAYARERQIFDGMENSLAQSGTEGQLLIASSLLR